MPRGGANGCAVYSCGTCTTVSRSWSRHSLTGNGLACGAASRWSSSRSIVRSGWSVQTTWTTSCTMAIGLPRFGEWWMTRGLSGAGGQLPLEEFVGALPGELRRLRAVHVRPGVAGEGVTGAGVDVAFEGDPGLCQRVVDRGDLLGGD